MTDDQKDFVVELIRNTVDYLHKQEILLIQLAGSIETSKEHPTPTPAEETAEESRKLFERLQETDPDYQYPFPWGRRLGKKADDDKPGLTHIVSETQQVRNIQEKPQPTPIRDAMANGYPKQEPWTRGTDVPLRQPTASELNSKPPKGAWE